MPAQQTQSNFLAEVGPELAKAWNAHAGDQTEITGSFSDPPPFEDGVAKLKKVTLAKYKPEVKSEELKGKWYFMAEAIILTPKKAKDPDTNELRPVAGKTTKVGPIPLCNTPSRSKDKTLDQHVANIMNEIRKLGISTVGADGKPLPHTKLPDLVKALNARAADPAKPLHIKCRAWKGAKATEGPYAGKEPMLQHVWMGLATDFDPRVDLAAGVDDGTPTAVGTMPTRNGTTKAPAAPAYVPPQQADDDVPNADGAYDDGTTGDGADLDALATVAQEGYDRGDKQGELATAEERAAVVTLRQIANQHGIDDDTFDGADDYAGAVAMIREAQGGDADGAVGSDDGVAEAPAEEEAAVEEPAVEEPAAVSEPPPAPKPWVPKVKETAKLTYKDAKTKKNKTVDVEITAVDKAGKTAAVVNTDDRKMKWPKIAWASLKRND